MKRNMPKKENKILFSAPYGCDKLIKSNEGEFSDVVEGYIQ